MWLYVLVLAATRTQQSKFMANVIASQSPVILVLRVAFALALIASSDRRVIKSRIRTNCVLGTQETGFGSAASVTGPSTWAE